MPCLRAKYEQSYECLAAPSANNGTGNTGEMEEKQETGLWTSLKQAVKYVCHSERQAEVEAQQAGCRRQDVVTGYKQHV